MSLFTPVLSVMNRSRYAGKFLIIITVFMLPYCWLSISKLADVNQTRETSQLELQGLQSLEQYLSLYREGLTLASLQVIGYARNKDDAHQAQAEQLERYLSHARALNEHLQAGPFSHYQVAAENPASSLNSKSNNQGLSAQMIEHSHFLRDITANIRAIATAAKLSQDSDPLVYDNIDKLISHIVPMYDTVAQTQTMATYLVAYSFLESGARPTVLNQLTNLALYVQPGDSSIDNVLSNAASETLARYKSEIVDVYSASGFFDLDAVDQWREHYEQYVPYLRQIDQATALLLEDSRTRLQARFEQNTRELFIWAGALSAVVLLLIYLFIGFYLSVRNAIRDITLATQRLAAGDFRTPVATAARDELGDLANDFNQMQSRISSLIAEVAQFSESTREKAQGVTTSASTSRASVERQAKELELIATSMSELVSNVQEVSQNSHITADKANNAGEQCREGSRQVESAVSGINHLFSEMDDSINAINSVERESQAIAKAVDLIKSVAEQTNLLALNAAIEAARAGAQGRGFAVVADEVRSLAIRSHQLTGEIDQTIERLRQQVTHAVKTIRASHQSAASSVERITETASAFNAITAGMEQIIDHNIQIASAAEQQAAVVQGVEQNTLHIKKLSETNADEAQRAVQTSDELSAMTERLHTLIGSFKV